MSLPQDLTSNALKKYIMIDHDYQIAIFMTKTIDIGLKMGYSNCDVVVAQKLIST